MAALVIARVPTWTRRSVAEPRRDDAASDYNRVMSSRPHRPSSSDAGAARQAVTGLVLAGGLGRRMGGLDKGLVTLAGRPMIEHVLAALRPQVREVWINANRNHDRYAAYGHPLVEDGVPGFAGPLAGVLGGLQRVDSGFLLTVPCDAPLLAPDLAERLHAACLAYGADVAVASDGQRRQPVFLLLRAGLAPALSAWLDDGGRKVDDWLRQQRAVEVPFADEPDTFVNLNDPAECAHVEARLISCRRSG
jgi:molybdopterin-guanine dinucleotide biosynthesis protein A